MSNPFSPHVPYDYPRICDLCGMLKRISQLHKQGQQFICDDHPGWRTKEQLSRGNARQKPIVIHPVENPKPQERDGPSVYESDEARILNFLCSQEVNGEDGSLRAGVAPFELVDVSAGGGGSGAPVSRVDGTPSGVSDLNYHPLIPGTVALWQLNGTLADSSGNGLDLVDNGGGVAYGPIDSLISTITGFNFNAPGRDLISGLSAPLRIAGDMTIQWLMLVNGTTTQTFVQADPGPLYSAYYGLTGYAYADQGINATFSPTVDIGTRGRQDHITYVRSGSTVTLWVNGALRGTMTGVGPNSAIGNERIRVGGFSGGANLTATMASMRILNFARLPADIVADYLFTTGAKYPTLGS